MTEAKKVISLSHLLMLLLVVTSQGPGQLSVIRAMANDIGCTELDFDADVVVIREGWLQEAPATQEITAAYMVIENRGDRDISLLSATTDVSQVVELHKMELVDGLMKMRRVQSIKIPAADTVELKPGGYHMMVIGLKRELKEGEMVTFSLQFSNDTKKTIKIPVKPRSAVIKER